MIEKVKSIYLMIKENFLRREWDSNPRYPHGYTRSPGVPVQPLLHLSVITKIKYLVYNKKLQQFTAEGQGFEPWVLCKEYTGFRDRPIRPL